jgi:ABC-type transporter Mla MlaB component
MPELTIQVSAADSREYQLAGQLTYDNACSSEAVIETLLSDLESGLVLDFSKVDRVDTAGIAVILSWTRLAQKNQQSFEVKGLPTQALALIQNSGLTALLPLA